MSTLTILGSAGWIPEDRRMTTCLGVTHDKSLFVFDAGTGIARFREEPFRGLRPPEDRPVHVFLTHLHLDHTVGLTFLPALWSNPTVIHAPSPAETAGTVSDDAESPSGTGTQAGLQSLFGGPFFPTPLERLLPSLALEAMGPGEHRIEGVRLRVRGHNHPGGSLGYRVEDLLVFETDFVHDDESVDFARGVQVLVHEAWSSEGNDPGGTWANSTGHSSAEQAARVARDAGVGELLLSHLPPFGEDYRAEMLARAQSIFPRTSLCSDGLTRGFD